MEEGARFRALRGVVLQCLRPMRRRWESVGPFPERSCIPFNYQYQPKTLRCCRWCGRPVEGRKHWHRACGLMFTACSGGVTNIYGTPVIPVGPCANCGAAESAKPVPWHARDDNWYKGQEFYGASLDLDHRVPLAVARERGPDEFVRAFLPANLQWLCTDCHVAKTSKDRGDMARLSREHKTRQRSLI